MSPLRPAALLVGLWLLLGAGAARAEPPPGVRAAAEKESAAKQAMALNDEAWALYEQGRYRAAIDKLEAALRMDPDGKDLVYNLALLHEKLANLKAAEGYYRRYLEMETDPKARTRTQGVLRRLEGAQRDAPPAAPSAAPGPVRAPAPAPPRPVRPWVIATGSVAAVAFLTGGIFGLAALARNPGAHATTSAGVSIDDLQTDARRAHAYAVVADASFLLTAAATGTAAFLYFSTPRADPSARLVVGPGLVRVAF
jgi:tetratricopeptide (TPR) repeat protein